MRKDFVYHTFKKHLGDIQISSRAKEEIQRFMEGNLDEMCNKVCTELKIRFKEQNLVRKNHGHDEHKRIKLELVQDVLNERIKLR